MPLVEELNIEKVKKKGLFVGTNYTYKLVFLFIINSMWQVDIFRICMFVHKLLLV